MFVLAPSSSLTLPMAGLCRWSGERGDPAAWPPPQGSVSGVRSPGYSACDVWAVQVLSLAFGRAFPVVCGPFFCPLCLQAELFIDAALLLKSHLSPSTSSSCFGRTQRSISWNISRILRRKKFRSSGSRVASSTSSHVAIVSSCRLKATFIEIEITSR